MHKNKKKNKKIKLSLVVVIAVLFLVSASLVLLKKSKEYKWEKYGNQNRPCKDGSNDCISSNGYEKKNVESRFGFLNAYGQSVAKLSDKWNANFKMDLVNTSSDLMKDVSVGWSREFVFIYPSNFKDEYTLKRFEKAKENGTKLIATVGVEEGQMNNPGYAKWLKDVTEYYSEDIKYWQVHNEVGRAGRFSTPSAYVNLLKKTSGEIKNVCPDCKVMMASFTPNVNKSYYEEVISKGDMYVDAYDFHIFGDEDMNAFRDFVGKVNKPVFVTEMATHSGDPLDHKRHQSETQQAKKLIKLYAEAFEAGADYVFWSQFVEWYEFMGNVDNFFDYTGLVYNGMCLSKSTGDVCKDGFKDKGAGVKKEAYYSLKTLIGKIDGFTEVKKIKDGQYRFVVNGKYVYVLWCNGEDCSVTGEIKKADVITNYKGEVIDSTLENIKLTDSPIFVEVN